MTHELLALQLSEVEMLRSMFPGDSELHMDDRAMLDDMQRYLDGKREALPRQLGFTLSLEIEDKQIGLQLVCSLPLDYPNVVPEVFARCQAMSRPQQKQINDDLHAHIEEQERGELCLTAVVLWVQENAARYLEGNDSDLSVKGNALISVSKCKFSGLSRLWIYSHHIYRKELLKKIPDSAKELDLTGFCLPGKPGIICVEGYRENCDSYWQRLKYPNWKHISCKHRDEAPLEEGTDPEDQLTNFRLFSGFEELAFEAHGDYGLRNDYHMDLGQFRQYLQDHDCAFMFQIFFGLQGKSAST